MATTSSTSSTTANPYAFLNNSTSAKTATATEEQQDRFLKLLVTQVKNQDPLNPMQNAEFTSQLAQINTVTGIDKLNNTVASLLGYFQSAQAMQAADMVGKNVLVSGKEIALTSEGAYAGVQLAAKADSVKVSIKNAAGSTVRTLDLGSKEAGTAVFSWDGKDDDGNALDTGRYSFAVEAKLGDNKVQSDALNYGTVSAVVRNGTGFSLDLGRQGKVAFDDVKQII